MNDKLLIKFANLSTYDLELNLLWFLKSHDYDSENNKHWDT